MDPSANEKILVMGRLFQRISTLTLHQFDPGVVHQKVNQQIDSIAREGYQIYLDHERKVAEWERIGYEPDK